MRRTDQQTEQARTDGASCGRPVSPPARPPWGRASRCLAGTARGQRPGGRRLHRHRRARPVAHRHRQQPESEGAGRAGRRVRRLSPPARSGQREDGRRHEVHGARGPAGRPEGGRRVRRHARPPARPPDHRRPRAGKDVYCEKPLTHWSQFDVAKRCGGGRQTGRLVQVGTQYMADDNYPEIIRLVREGVIGKPMHVTCSYFRNGDWGERMPVPDPDAKPGPDLNWERFLGDAPKVPSRSRGSSSGGCTGITRADPPPIYSCTCSRPSSRSSSSAIPSAFSAAAALPVRPRGARPVQHHRRLPGRPQRRDDQLALQRDPPIR